MNAGIVHRLENWKTKVCDGLNWGGAVQFTGTQNLSELF